jgi:hypothetical protein
VKRQKLSTAIGQGSFSSSSPPAAENTASDTPTTSPPFPSQLEAFPNTNGGSIEIDLLHVLHTDLSLV